MLQIISGFIGNLILMVGILIFGKIVLSENIKISKKKLLACILLSSLIHSIILMTVTGTLKTILMAIINIIFVVILFKSNIKKAIFLVLLYMIILIIPELLTLFVFSNILNISKSFSDSTYASNIVLNIISSFILIIITYFLRKVLRNLINTKIENNRKIIVLSIFTFICMVMFLYTIIREFKISHDTILYLIAIVILSVVLFSLIKQTIRNNEITREYEELMKFMITYEKGIEEQRILRHETKNEFRTIKAKIYDKQKEQEIIDYINEIINEKYEVKQEEYAQFGYLPPNGIKGLCYFKKQEAENKEINVMTKISKRVEQSTIYDLDIKQQRDFGKILGVILDNAIEASAKSKEKKMGIEAYSNKNQEFRMIVSNTYNNEIDKEKIGKEKFSTKGKNRGHGLLLVNHIIKMNKIFEQKTEIREDLYIQTIIIKKH